MNSHEPKSHSFVLRIWIEEDENEETNAIWTGNITHVISNENRYFRDFGKMEDFIKGYFEELGEHTSPLSRLRQRLAKWSPTFLKSDLKI